MSTEQHALPAGPAALLDRPGILVIDDDLGTRETADWALRPAGYRVTTAASGAEGISIAKSGAFDLMLIDLQLPDMLGTDVIRILRSEVAGMTFVLVSGFLTIRTAVDAMKLGALDVLEKPIEVDDLLAVVRSVVGDREAPERGESAGSRPPPGVAAPSPAPMTPPRSAADRWALHVLKACEAEGDLRTLEKWATFAGLSYTSLRESCRLVGIRPHDARDLARLLRAVIQSSVQRCPLEALLDVSDRRTLESLLDRAGLGPPSHAGSVSVEQFLRLQRFVPSDNVGLRVLRNLLVRSQPS